MKKTGLKKTVCALLALSVLALSSCAKNGGSDDPGVTAPPPADPDGVYATVNGEDITIAEISYFSARERASVITGYMSATGQSWSEECWDAEYEGSTPREILAQKTLDDAVAAKVKLIEMKKNDIYDDITYNGLYQRAVNYNKEHENAAGTVGLKTIDLSTFYTYYVSTGSMALENILGEDLLKPTEEEKTSWLAEHEAGFDEVGRENADSIALNSVIREKYDAYIADLIASADVHVIG